MKEELEKSAKETNILKFQLRSMEDDMNRKLGKEGANEAVDAASGKKMADEINRLRAQLDLEKEKYKSERYQIRQSEAEKRQSEEKCEKLNGELMQEKMRIKTVEEELRRLEMERNEIKQQLKNLEKEMVEKLGILEEELEEKDQRLKLNDSLISLHDNLEEDVNEGEI